MLFKNPADSQRAIDQYNNVALDGKPLKLKAIAPAGAARCTINHCPALPSGMPALTCCNECEHFSTSCAWVHACKIDSMCSTGWAALAPGATPSPRP